MRILVVEDSPMLAGSLSRFIRFFGHEVTEAANLREARAAISEAKFELVLADVQLPDGLGTELIDAVGRGCRIATMSGWPTDYPRRHAARWIAHVEKPFTPEAIEDLLASAELKGASPAHTRGSRENAGPRR